MEATIQSYFLLEALNPKQKRFCDEYLVDHNGKRSAIRAGYAKHTAEITASKLLRVPKVKAYVAAKEQKIERKLAISAERTMLELGRIAYGDARQFYDDKGDLIPIHKLNDDAAACLAGMEVEETYNKKGQAIILKKIKRYDKLPALNMLAKHFKIFEEAPAAPVTINIGSLSVDELKSLLAIKKKATT